jgi:glutamate-ammonia-ligase adenylyltransferase
LAEVQGQVHAIFDRLLGGHKDHEQRLPAPIQALLDAPELLPEDERQQAWALEAGFARPRQSLGHLLVLRERAGSPFAPGAPARLAQLGALCLRDSAQSADPDLALVHLTSLMLTGGALWGFVEALLGSAPMRAALMNLLGASRHLAQMLIRQPEWVGALVEDQGWMTPGAITSGDPQRCGREALGAELARYMEPVQGQEARLAALRRFQQRRELRVGLADLAGLLEVEQVGRALSDLAEAVLEEVCREAWREVAPRLAGGQGSSEGEGPPGFCVLALGRLGSRELTYGSDLDLLFFYEEGPEPWRASSGEALAAYGKLARRVVAFLTAQLGQGPLYNIDARLRPNGRQGALVVSLAGWLDYHERQGQLWERQSLLRARAVAGDRGFGAGVEAQVRALCFAPRTDEEARALCAELAAMRIRMREAAQPPPPKPPAVVRTRPQGYNLKLGTDGIADAEFAVQALQMVFGAQHEALRTTSVSEALRAARALGLMPAALLEGAAQGRRLLCLLESRLRILEGQGEDALPLDDPEAMLRLARRVGYRGEDPAELLRRELARARAQVGALREAVLERAEFLDRAQGEGSGDADLGGGR